MQLSEVNHIELTVVICAFNEEQHISRSILSLYAEVGNADSVEVIILDNESTDNTYRIATDTVDELNFDNACVFSILHCPLTSSRNTGLEKARGQYIAYVDADGYVKPGWYKAIKKAIDEGLDIFCGTVGIDPEARGFSRFIFELHYLPSLETASIPIIGANMAFRVSMLRSIGGFHEVPTARGDETLLLYLLERSSKKLIVKTDDSSIVINTYVSDLYSWLKLQDIEGQFGAYIARRHLFFYLSGYFFRFINVFSVPLFVFSNALSSSYFFLLLGLLLIRHLKRWSYYRVSLKQQTSLLEKPLAFIILLLGSFAADFGYIRKIINQVPKFQRASVSDIIRGQNYE